MIDTGAQVSLISAEFFKQIKKHGGLTIRPSNIILSSANQTGINNWGECDLTLHVGGQPIQHTFLIAENLNHPVIIGWDLITEKGMLINGKKKTLDYQGVSTPLQDLAPSSFVRLTCDVELPAYSMASVPAKKARTTGHKNGLYICTAVESGVLREEPGVAVVNTVSIVTKGRRFMVNMINETGRTYKLKKGNVIGTLEAAEVNEVDQTPQQNKLDGNCVKRQLEGHMGCKNIQQLLMANEDLFAKDDQHLGKTELLKIDIDTADHPPIGLKAYRAPLGKRMFIEEKVEDLLKADIIRKSRSPWSAPVVVATKKDGTNRLCVDYRRLNDVTTKFVWPLPHIDDLLASFHGAKCFSVLDLRSGYHQVPILEQDKKKTAFVTHCGQFEYNFMPFGLCNAPGVFSELMSEVLKGINGKFVTSYLDDIIVWSASETEHLEHLEQVMNRLRSANLKLKMSKCEFFKKELDFLGHTVTTSGIRPQTRKISAITNMARPQNVTDVRSFIGMTSYYRRYIPRYTAVAKPLLNITRKNAQFVWTDETEEAFDALKTALTTEPILAYPDMNLPFILYSDASKKSIGAALVQEQEGQEKAIEYMSNSLNDTQQKWGTIQREAYAIMQAVHKFKPYLHGHQFTIRTDHKPLKYMFRAKMENEKLKLWAMELAQHNCKIEYITGPQNKQADFLSRLRNVEVINLDRLPGDETVEEDEEFLREVQEEDALPDLKLEGQEINISEEQRQDTSLNKLRTHQDYISVDDILYYMGENPSPGLKLVVPRHLRSLVLEAAHMEVAHMGIEKTYYHLQKSYHWPHIFREVASYVNKCVTCKQRKMKKNMPPLQEMDQSTIPFEKIAVDMCGPYPDSLDGNKYLLTVIDTYTGWPEMFAVEDKRAETVGKKILEEVISRHGCPKTILSDNGPEFVNEIIAEICKTLKTARITTSVYRPQANGKIERMHRVWGDIVSKYTEESENWDRAIPSALFAIRMSKGDLTGHSPFFLLHLRDPFLPLDTLLKPRRKYLGEEEHLKILERHHQAMNTVRKHMKKAKERMKRYHQRKVRDEEIKVGDPVYLYNTRKKNKLERPWKAYYRVIEQLGPVNYRIRNQITGEVHRIHKIHLRKSNIEWKLPEAEVPRLRRRAQLAASPSSSGSEGSGGSSGMSGMEDHNNGQQDREEESSWSSEDNIPLARYAGQVPPEVEAPVQHAARGQQEVEDSSWSSEDDIPLARYTGQEVEMTEDSGASKRRRSDSEGEDIEGRHSKHRVIDIEEQNGACSEKRLRSQDSSPDEESEGKIRRIEGLEAKEERKQKRTGRGSRSKTKLTKTPSEKQKVKQLLSIITSLI